VNVTIYLYNETGLVKEVSSTSEVFAYTFTDLADGVYYVNATAIDKAGNTNSTETRIFTIDTVNPEIEFVDPTPANNSFVIVNDVTINVSSNDLNFANVTIYLYNETGLVKEVSSTSEVFAYTFTDLDDGVYYVNATAIDKAGNTNSTETRKIIVDTTRLIITFVPPTYENDSMYNLKKVNFSFINFTIQGIFVEAKIEWNGVNYSVDCISDYCFRNFTNLVENDYYYKAWAKTSLGYWWWSEERVLYLNWWIPIYDEFKNFSNTTNFRMYNNITIQSVDNVKLENDNGLINWKTTINASGIDYDEAIEFLFGKLIINYSVLHSSHNSTVEIFFYNISVEEPVLLIDENICEFCEILDYSKGDVLIANLSYLFLDIDGDGIVSIRVVDNSTLKIWDSTDNKSTFVNQNAKFYANYTDILGNTLYENSSCFIRFYNSKTDSWTGFEGMSFNDSSKFWEFERTFDSKYYTLFEVYCNSSNYSPRIKQDTLRILPWVNVTFGYDQFRGLLFVKTDCEECYFNSTLFVPEYATLTFTNVSYDASFLTPIGTHYVWNYVQNIIVNYSIQYNYARYSPSKPHRIFAYLQYIE
ncbi:MAG: Ig-like domain-containing protein, partial [Candidatus Woesearchaeota archaeon]